MFRMLITTNFKFKLFEKGKTYKDEILSDEVLTRWHQKGFIEKVDDNKTVQSRISRKKKQSDEQ